MTDTRYTSVIIPEGKTVRVMAQTASRDYTATIVPGEYPIEYTDVNYRPTPEGERPYYALIRVMIESPERRESSVEWGGVTLASHTVPASTDKHTISLYAYMLETNSTGTPDERFGYQFLSAVPA